MQRIRMTLLMLLAVVPVASAQNAIQLKAEALGSALGAPVAAVRTLSDGARAQEFANGAIYYSTATDAHFVGSDALKKYQELGGERSKLGYPVGDTRTVRSGARQTIFQHGFITTNRAGDTSAEILAGIDLTNGSLVATAIPTLSLDDSSMLTLREGVDGPMITLTCSCVDEPQGPTSQRLGFCTLIIRDKNQATCKSSTASPCRGSCVFEIVDK